MMKDEYDTMSEEEIVVEAEIANELSELWNEEPYMNVLMLLSRAMQTIVNRKLPNSPMNTGGFEDCDEAWDEDVLFDPETDEVPPDWSEISEKKGKSRRRGSRKDD